MKKTILIISLLMLSNVAWAQKAPEGFCGLKWGSGKEELKKLLDPIRRCVEDVGTSIKL